MTPKASVATIDYTKATSAKELLDEIGKQVQQQVHTAAVDYVNDLKGYLTNVKFSNGETVTTNNACNLDHTHDTTVSWGVINPCDRRSPDRFSDEGRSQCTSNRIKDSTSDDVGACAPYRKLQLCDYNLEKITDRNTTNTHNLLVDVLLAAKYEGESIVNNYQHVHHHTTEGICTALARSFADIGDVIRGKDLYLGNKMQNERVREKEKLQQNLKEIFKKIYEELIEKSMKKDAAKKRYEDSNDPNYYKLREDWWYANRYDVWKAMICKAPGTANYFRNTCSKGTAGTSGNCHCIDETVPTYFDYVPQYLRWFEEWAEDFCRKKQRKLHMLEQQCRGKDKSNSERYCSRNGYNCEETINRIGLLRMGKQCTNCLYACNPYIDWIDNKKKEFEKQKQKYTDEISRYNITNGKPDDSINNLYYKDFYEEFKNKYSNVTEFLKLLNKEGNCKNIEQIDKESEVDFTSTNDKDNNNNKTFSGSQYCRPCPPCGVKHLANGQFIEKDENKGECNDEELYKPSPSTKFTEIDVLSFGDKREDIIKKIDEFCDTRDSSKLNEKWKCYYGENAAEVCLLENKNNHTDAQKQKSFYDFFTYWVAHMLKDSEDWRTKKLNKCLKNGNAMKCKDGCKGDCDCFLQWITRKKTEWRKIKEHYEKQDGLPDCGHYAILEGVLELEFPTDITKAYGDANETERIKKMLANKNKQEKDDDTTHRSTILDELLDHEEEDAQECLEIHEEDEEKQDEKCDDGEEIHSVRRNPCSGGSDSSSVVRRHPALATKVAADMYIEARQQMGRRGGRNALKGHIENAQFKNGGSGSDLKEKGICSIDKDKHSNSANKDSNDPCNNKGNGFSIGTGWKSGSDIEISDPYLFLPPRREHFCTSNLEKINDTWVKGNGNANDTFLVDVLLAAKYQAERIKTMYKKNEGKTSLTEENDKETVCRAMKYSFADIGDIIRGRDMWDQNGGAKEMEGHLIEIFKEIKEKLPDDGIQKKYKDDNDDNKYINLRDDWWAANRIKVWSAMKCATKNAKIPCSGMPEDDYIPQRLRWMTEWAEWYCKMQKKEYKTLQGACKECMGKKTECTQGTKDCVTCKTACEKYKDEIKKWEDQWTKIKEKYEKLYEKAKNYSETASSSGTKDENDVLKFLNELQKANGVTSGGNRVRLESRGKSNTTDVYGTAAGYIHQEAHIDECQKQWVFCNSGSNGDAYAFKDPPKDYDTPCNCKNNVKSVEAPQERVSPPSQAPAPTTSTTVDNVCKIVGETLTENTLKAACPTKYENGREKYPNWKCMPTTTTTPSDSTESGSPRRAPRSVSEATAPSSGSDKGGICVPPRRRKLYVGKLEEWAKERESQAQTVEVSSQSGTSDPHKALREAFIQSSAVETYFLWHKYKQDKKRETEQKIVAEGAVVQVVSQAGEQIQTDLQKDLEEKGEIPDDFKRQMFYTLGDYRDICIGDETMIQTLIASDKDTKIEDIDKKIKNHINSGSNNRTPSRPPLPDIASVDPRVTWWDENAKHIWEGMICALTHKEKGDKIEKIQTTKGDSKNLFQKLKEGNDYSTVTFNGGFDEIGDGEKSKDAPPSGTTSLKHFVRRPFFFRWLEEWADEFCRKQRHKLGIIKNECRGTDDDKPCSGDGLPCYEKVPKNEEIYESLKCPRCSIPCRWYKRWIERKKDEFTKQKNAYEGQKKKKCENGSSEDGNGFCTKLNDTCTTAKEFLDNLQGEPCKNNKVKGEVNGEDEIKFDGNTFQPAEHCGTCSEFNVQCKGPFCIGDGKQLACSGGKIKAKDIGNGGNSTDPLNMVVSDKSGKDFKDDLEFCAGAGIFTGIRKDEWKCRKVCDVDICSQKKNNNGQQSYEHITVTEFVKRWLEYFFEDYNRIQKKLKTCTEGGNGNTCIKECVTIWIEKKRREWKNINDRYIDQKRKNDATSNNLKSYLETLIPQINLTYDRQKIKDLSTFMRLYACNCTDISDKQDGEKTDIVQCLLEKLKKKIDAFIQNPTQTDDNPKANCAENSSTPVPEDDEEEELLEEDVNTEEAQKKMMPKICDKVVPTITEPVEKIETCDAISPDSKTEDNGGPGESKDDAKVDGSDDGNGDGSVTEVQEEEPVEEVQEKKADEIQISKDVSPTLPRTPEEPRDQKKAQKPTKQVKQTSQYTPSDWRDVMSASAFPWTVGVAFVALGYWWLLKKKTKPRVDLFSVMEIPKGEYDMPNLKSKNRYIPYKSAQYRGKRYIYVEGDTDEEKYAFMSDTTDITSSSESEYEEIDTYISRAPKYKTLIEVVLEPSKRETQNDKQSDDTPSNKFTDNEWNELKDEFISNMLQSEQNTEPNSLHDNMDEKPFIMSIHDRNLLSGEEYSYDMVNIVDSPTNISDSTNSVDIPTSSNHAPYSDIDLINDALNSGDYVDIYDEILKRKENELFGTEHAKNITSKRVVTQICDDPITNQINLFHKWLDRHRHMCQQWENKVDILHKLKEEWNKDNNLNSGITYTSVITDTCDNTFNGSNSSNSSDNKMINTNVSIQIDVNNPKPI
ncbi:erythrocyte membrane protein 1, PfEMP1 [Plasmodium sp. DRC-Itaito]|nr:erythrocyte membrane protein 1, PfEMP1 [Plasmodium sp. DRC-Itaito]